MAALQQALVNHERVRKATELPLFYGDKSKDTIDPEDFITRFQSASDIAGWVVVPPAGGPPNEHIKCEQFLSLLRGKAIQWRHAIELNADYILDDWAYLRDKFLTHYSPRYTARTACMSFAELQQSNDESVGDFYLRVTKAYRLLKKQRPPMVAVVRYNPGPFAADVPLPDINAARPIDIARGKDEGLEDMGRYMVQAMFLAGLKEEVRIKTMETRPNTHQEAYQTALNIECILKDKRGSKPIVSSIAKASQEDEEEEELDIDDDEECLLGQINAIRAKRGQRPARFAPKGNRSKLAIVCRYCKVTGHFQRDCFKRKKENGKMVDSQGKPFKVSQVEDEDQTENQSQPSEEDELAVQSIRSMSLSQRYYGISAIRDVTGEDEASPDQQVSNLSETLCERENTSPFKVSDPLSCRCQKDEENCTCFELMMDGRKIIEERSNWFETVGEENPFEDQASRDTLTEPLN